MQSQKPCTFRSLLTLRSETMIRVENVSKTYTGKQGTVEAVKDVSLEISRGEIFGVIGFSGAGKSTLIRLLNGLETVTSGHIYINEKDITTLKRKELLKERQKIAMIFQHFNLLWSRTVEENIAFSLEIAGVPKAERKAKVAELIDLVGLTGREKSYPSQLSGGQKQRVGIARALANDPEVLLCDEATSALDPKTTKDILKLLVEINQELGLTIVLITHEMHVVRQICHRVAVMEEGRVVESGEVIEVFKNPQQPITKQFVGEERVDDEIDEVFHHLSTSLRPGVAVRIQYLGDRTGDAVLSEAIRKLDATVSILQAKVNITQKGILGSMIILIEEESSKAEEVIEYLKQAEIIVEVLEHV
jgi:methionine import ATP-binding protein metN